MQTANSLQIWIAGLDRRVYGALVGITVGVIGGLVGLLLVVAGPVITLGAIIGALAGLYVLSNVSAALYGVVFTLVLLPFGTLPFKVVVTPTLLDAALGAFLLVYLMGWMTGRRQGFQITPVHALITLYILWLILSFVLGLRYGMPTSATLRQFAETLLSISLTFVLVDLLRDPQALRRLLLVVMIAVGIQAIAALILYMLPDATTERLLVRLARLGYPNGGVIRYIEDNPANPERAIGTWVDPNALGGVLAVAGVLIAPQLLTSRPVLRFRPLILVILGCITLGLILTFSRASMLAFAIGVTGIALFPRYRKFIPLIVLGAALLLVLPQTQRYIARFGQAFAGADLATQMRLGEYGDSLELISRYPVFGVGFTGTPTNDLYTHVASMYLIIANQIGLVGLGIYLVTIAAVLAYGWRAHRAAHAIPELEAIHLGIHAALIAALINATGDLYFFRLDFQASITLFWLVVALALASSNLALNRSESTVVKAS